MIAFLPSALGFSAHPDQHQAAHHECADPVAAVQNVFGLWGSGALTREASAPLVASDVHLDAKDGYPWVHPGYKVYHGLDGWMEWLNFLSHTHFQDFTPHQFRPADGDFGPGLSGVTALATYTPTNMKTWKSAPMQADTHTWIVDSECKIADVHFHWSDPQALDELWAGCDKVNLINWVFATWGGQSPYYPEGWNAAATEHFATPDSVTDASGGYAWEHATGYKVYTGHAGWDEWLTYLSQTDFPDFAPVVGPQMAADGEHVEVHVQYTPTIIATGKTTVTQTDTQMWEIDTSVCQIKKVTFTWGDAAALDELYAP